MTRPEELTADMLWELLGEYGSDVGDAEGVRSSYFTDNKYVIMAIDQYCDETPKNHMEVKC